jgi:hypothetical protein
VVMIQPAPSVSVKVPCFEVQPLAPLSTSSVQTEAPSAVTSKSSANQPGSSKAASVAYRSRRPMVVPAYGVRST